MTATFHHGHALVIGAGADLLVTIEDASAVADLLRDPGRCAYPPDNVTLLTNEQARREHILAALESLASRASSDQDATVIVYFSGHGLDTPQGHLVPYGYAMSDLDGTAIPGPLFNEKLRAIKARKLLVLLDCCHAAGQADAKAPPLPQAALPARALQELERGSGRVVIASSRKDEISRTGYPYSAFTNAVLQGLAGYGAFEQDGYARVLDLALYVGRMVPNRTHDAQHPILKVSNLEDNFALAYYAAGEERPKKLPWAVEVPDIAPGLDERQIATWRRMLANKRENLLLIEERMSEYINQEDIPLQLIKNQRKTEADIVKLEQNLGINQE
jgi:hypothetical protein